MKDRSGFFAGSLPPAPQTDPKDDTAQCAPIDPDAVTMAPFCAQLQLSPPSASTAFDMDKNADELTLKEAIGKWNLARSQYELSVAQADLAYQASVQAAEAAFSGKTNKDSTSRHQNLHCQMEEAVGAALVTFEGSLAAAAGTLIAAYVAYVTKVGTAPATQISSDATARQTFR